MTRSIYFINFYYDLYLKVFNLSYTKRPTYLIKKYLIKGCRVGEGEGKKGLPLVKTNNEEGLVNSIQILISWDKKEFDKIHLPINFLLLLSALL